MIATSAITGRTRGGCEWVPTYIVGLDQSRCIGCGRCYKTCPRDVFALVERDQDDDEDETAKVMSIADALDCIGCTACANTCPKGCLTHAAQPCAA
jgi:Nif-specific ferredoxin III